MMNYIAIVCFSFFSAFVNAGFSWDGTYTGEINGVAVGHWGHVGVGLPSGQKCNNRSEVLLLKSNEYFKEILSVLLAAEASGKQVTLYRVTSQVQEIAATYSYCIIGSAALGDYPTW